MKVLGGVHLQNRDRLNIAVNCIGRFVYTLYRLVQGLYPVASFAKFAGEREPIQKIRPSKAYTASCERLTEITSGSIC
jgi:hypothetical protein